MTSFDKHSTFLPAASKTVSEAHDLLGTVGSSLLSLRNDLKTFCTDAKLIDLAMSVVKKGETCQEQYVIRLMNHTLRVTITSHKPTAPTLARKPPDTALKVTRMQDAIRSSIARPYFEPLAAFIGAAFKHNSETCTFQADSDEGEWNLIFQDARHRTVAEIDIYEDSLAPGEPTFIFLSEPPKKVKPIKTKKPAALLAFPPAAAPLESAHA